MNKRKFSELTTDNFKVTISYTCNFHFNDHIFEEACFGETKLEINGKPGRILNMFNEYMEDFAERLRTEEWIESVICSGSEPSCRQN